MTAQNNKAHSAYKTHPTNTQIFYENFYESENNNAWWQYDASNFNKTGEISNR